jgi:hypothetical protein
VIGGTALPFLFGLSLTGAATCRLHCELERIGGKLTATFHESCQVTEIGVTFEAAYGHKKYLVF